MVDKFNRRHRFILHSDLNNFFASVECLVNPKISNTAVIVVGDSEMRHGVVLAKNNIAKSYGISTGDTIYEASKKCPKDVRLTQVKTRHWLYEKVSKKVQAIYHKYTDYVEMFGIDEAWLDITPTAKDYTDALEIADMLRREIKDTIGLTVSIGVSYNKIFAKLGSDLKKPDAITLITKGNFKDRIWQLPCNALLFVGKATDKKFEKMNILTIGDIAKAEPRLLQTVLGVNGKKLWEYASGLDNAPVKHIDEDEEVKSIGNSLTYAHDLTTLNEVKVELYNLAEQVAKRLRDKKLYCNEIQIFVKYYNLESSEHQAKLPHPTDTSKDIGVNALELFNKHYDMSIPIRALGIRLKDFTTTLQTSLLNSGRELAKQETLEKTIDQIRAKYGTSAISRGHNV